MDISLLRKMASTEMGRRYLQAPEVDPVAEALLVKAANADQELLKIASRLPGDTLENYEQLGGTFKLAAGFSRSAASQSVRSAIHKASPAMDKARVSALEHAMNRANKVTPMEWLGLAGAGTLTAAGLAKAVKEHKKEKTSAAMPSFTKQDRPKKVKEIYRALKRDHPNMPAEMKARIAARQGKRGHQHQGPPYKGPLTKEAIGTPMFQPAAPATGAMPRMGAPAPIGTLKPPSPTNSMPGTPGSAGGGAAPIKEPTIPGAGSEAGKTAAARRKKEKASTVDSTEISMMQQAYPSSGVTPTYPNQGAAVAAAGPQKVAAVMRRALLERIG